MEYNRPVEFMKKVLRVLGTIALLLVMYYLLQVLLLSVSMAVATHVGNLPSESLQYVNNTQYLEENPAVATYFVNAQATGLFLSAFIMLLFIHFAGFYKLRLQLLRSLAPRPLLFSTLLVFSSMFALNIFVQWFPLEDNLGGVFSGLSNNVLGILSLAFLAPLLEEVLFRGAIQGMLMRLFGRPQPAIIVAALIFGVYHMNPVQTVYATLLGIILGWIYYRTGSLLSVIVGHVLNNSLAVVTTLLYSASEEEAVADSSAGIVSFLVFAFLSIFFAVKLHRSLPPVEETETEK